MTEYADKEICERLYKLSNWDDCSHFYYRKLSYPIFTIQKGPIEAFKFDGSDPCEVIPAYTLAFILDKLPRTIVRDKRIYHLVITNWTSDGSWIADYYSGTPDYINGDRGRLNWMHNGSEAKLTEDMKATNAAALLAIQLFEQGILKREDALVEGSAK